jgi:hypothetical protein
MDFNKFNRGADFLKKRTEAMKQRKDETFVGGRDYIFKTKVTMYQPKDGENVIRCLPGAWEEAYTPWLEVYIHYQIGANNSQFLCSAKMLKKSCAICEEHKKLLDSGKNPEEIRSLQPQLRAICWVIDRLEEAKGPQIWVMPYTKIAKEILTHSFSRKSGEAVMVDDPLNGWDIIFNKAGKLKNTQYSGLRKDDEASPLHSDEEVMTKWLDFISKNVIPEMIQYKDYNYIKESLHGLTPEDSKPVAAITSTQSKAKEVKEEKPQTAKTVAVENSIPVGEGISIASLAAMDRSALEQLIESKKLTTDPKEWDDEDSLREAISLEMDLTN